MNRSEQSGESYGPGRQHDQALGETPYIGRSATSEENATAERESRGINGEKTPDLEGLYR